MRTHSKGAFKLDVPASPDPGISMEDIDEDLDDDLEEEADSTAHPTSNCAASSTTVGDHGESQSEMGGAESGIGEDDGDEEPDIEATVEVPVLPTIHMDEVISPRTAAKRRAQSVEAAERLRARGRRRIDDNGS